VNYRDETNDARQDLYSEMPLQFTDLLRFADKAEKIAARADARIAELVKLLRETRDCVLDCHNAEVLQRHSRAERAHYYAGLVAQVDAALAKENGNG